MTLFDFFRLVYRNINWLIFLPLVMSATVFLLSINEPKEYKSNALIYTGLASGYNIESGSADKVDYRQVNSAYDNMLIIIDSRFTLEEVGLRLLALNLSQPEPNENLGKLGFELLMEVFPMDKREKVIVVNDSEKTYENLLQLFRKGDPIIGKLIKGTGSYSVEKLKTVSVKRIKSSDMIELSYSSYDPGICRNTLSVLLDVFIDRFREMKQSETGSVIAYFEQELRKAKLNLELAEDELTAFKVKSRVINYGEETKALAIKKQDALSEYAQLKMNLKATEAALKELESKLEIRKEQLENNISIVEYKKTLLSITKEIALLESNHMSDSVIAESLNEQLNMKNMIRDKMAQIVKTASTPEGIPGNQLITDWLNNLIQYNRDLVSVQLYKKRLQEIDQQYDNFTPMGSTIDRMERQISVYEREYLEVLHGLNQSRLREHNIQLTSDLDIMDKPSYPIQPEASKRLLLVIAAGLAGFFGTLVFIIIIELLDGTLKKPDNVTKQTGLEVAGAIPVIDEKFQLEHADLLQRLAGLIVTKMTMAKYFSKRNNQELIVTFSINKEEGKGTVNQIIFDEFKQSGEKVLWIKPIRENEIHNEDVILYNPDQRFKGIKTIQDLVVDKDISAYRYILLEIPPLNEGKIPVHVVESADLSLVIARADRAWSTAHTTLINDYSGISGKKPLMILNGVKLHFLDQILSEVPIKRSTVVNKIRSIIKREFSSNFKKN